jgi:hypothetical protein
MRALRFSLVVAVRPVANVRYWHLADNSAAPANVRFWTKADKAGIWLAEIFPLMTQSRHHATE